MAFRAWPNDLPSEVEVGPIQLPGRGSRLSEPPHERLSSLVQAIAPALLPHLDKPFALFGHSMGAIICFELTRHLRRQHQPGPVHIFVSGRRAPQLQTRRPPIHQLAEHQFLEELRHLNGTPEPVLRDPEMMQLLLPMLRADFALSETYVYVDDEPLDCPITAFGGIADSWAGDDALSAWRVQTNSIFRLRMFPGDHFFLNSAREALLTEISKDLVPHVRREIGGEAI